MGNIDFSRVSEIIHDFSNKKISVRTKEGFCIAESTYASEAAFFHAGRQLQKKFTEELERREKEAKEVANA